MIQSQHIKIDLLAQHRNGLGDDHFVLIGYEVSEAAHQRQQIGDSQRCLGDVWVTLQWAQPHLADLLTVLWEDPRQRLPPLRVLLQEVEAVFSFDNSFTHNAALGRTVIHFRAQRERAGQSWRIAVRRGRVGRQSAFPTEQRVFIEWSSSAALRNSINPKLMLNGQFEALRTWIENRELRFDRTSWWSWCGRA